ncbi:MAG: AAA family ATPase [Actinomycetales bacterium]|nr:AAA family ATPase [Actinomycetales bacterium]
MPFVGRQRELAELRLLLETIRRGQRADRGIAVLLRGRRRVGKSRLVTEFIARSGLPSVYFQAARGSEFSLELSEFADTIASSSLPGAALAAGNRPTSLTAALTLLAAALPDESPAIAVIDEAPWLLEGIAGGAGELQRVWDRTLATKPVLLLLLGSDLAMMESLGSPDQPFHGRATEMVLDALTPHDVASMTGLDAFDAFDAFLITGGLPLVAQEWEHGMSRDDFLRESFTRSTSALVVSGARVLDSEFPETAYSRAVLAAIGGRGERTFSGIHAAIAGGSMSHTTLTASLRTLATKRVVAADEPLSTKPATKDRRWRIADPALRFWLAFVEPALGEVDRARPDLAIARVNRSYESWRGRAIEPVVRSALTRLLPDDQWRDVEHVGGWWPRNNNPEIDLVGADRIPANHVGFVGAIKWRKAGSVTTAEITQLAADALHVPGFTEATPLVVVSGGRHVTDRRIRQSWTPTDLIQAWR